MSRGTQHSLMKAVDAVLDQIEFTDPVSLDDTIAVKEAIAANIDGHFKVEVYHRHRDVVVLVLDDNRPTIQRIVPVVSIAT